MTALASSVVAWLGLMAGVWALTPHFATPAFVVPSIVVTGVVVLLGIGTRNLARSRWWAPPVQLVGLLLVLGFLYNRPPGGGGTASPQTSASTLLFGLPTRGTLEVWLSLSRAGVEILRTSAPPAPSTEATAFLIAATAGVLALLTDTLAATRPVPALAGLVMSTPYLVSVANSDGNASGWFALGPAVCALTLLGLAEGADLRRWTGRRHLGSSHAIAAVAMGTCVLLIASLAAGYLPRFPTTYLTEGLGRAAGRGVVAFSPRLDVGADLQSQDATPVLRYTTTAKEPPVLRVAVSYSYVDGSWLAQRPRAVASSAPVLGPAVGVAAGVTRHQQEITVRSTSIAAPYLAVPYPVTGGVVTDAQWAVDPDTGVAVSDRTPSTYRLPYDEIAMDPQGPGLDQIDDWTALPEETLSVSGDEFEVVEPYLSEIITDESASPFAQATEIQDWLRSPRFTYSLQLTPPPAGMSQAEIGRTALARFLQTRRGYCVQFTTAMVMMARARGIPARAVTGFLPGVEQNGERVVRRTDAHAWPELYFASYGWVRFEPTPGGRSGQPPPYARSTPSGTASPTPTSSASASASLPSASPSAPAGQRPEVESDSGSVPVDEGGTSAWIPTLLAALIVGLLLAVLPVRARLRYRHRVREAATDHERAVEHWAFLLAGLSDLGFIASPHLSPRAQAEEITHQATLQSAATTAIRRLAGQVEDARYAPPADPSAPARQDQSADVAVILKDAALVPVRSRQARYLLAPSYATNDVAAWVRSVRAPSRDESPATPAQ